MVFSQLSGRFAFHVFALIDSFVEQEGLEAFIKTYSIDEDSLEDAVLNAFIETKQILYIFKADKIEQKDIDFICDYFTINT